MKLKKILAFLASVSLLLTVSVPYEIILPASAEKQQETEQIPEYTEGIYENLSYRKYADRITITGLADRNETISGTLTIPAEINGLPVREITASAFYGQEELTAVNLPDGLEKIDTSVFENCSKLAEIYIPDSVYHIGLFAFDETAWLENHPNGLIYAGKVVYCYKGAYISLPEELRLEEGTVGIAEGAFSVASGTTYYASDRNFIAVPLILPRSIRCIDTTFLKFAYYQSRLHIGNIYYEGSEEEFAQIEFADNGLGYYSDPVTQCLDGHAVYYNTTETSHEPVYTNIYTIGDINQDDAINVLDVILLNKVVLGHEYLTVIQNKSADLDGDGTVSATDSLFLMKCIVGIEENLPEAPEIHVDPKNKFYQLNMYLDEETQNLLNNAERIPKRDIIVYDRQSSPEKIEFAIHLSDKDIAILENFAQENFSEENTLAEKLYFTHQWIHYNTDYAYIGQKWNSIENLSYPDAIFNHKMGQCVQYNGAIAAMLAYYGYDVYMVKGWILGNVQHYWTEVVIDGKVYEVETGNYGKNGEWQNFFSLIPCE